VKPAVAETYPKTGEWTRARKRKEKGVEAKKQRQESARRLTGSEYEGK